MEPTTTRLADRISTAGRQVDAIWRDHDAARLSAHRADHARDFAARDRAEADVAFLDRRLNEATARLFSLHDERPTTAGGTTS